MAMYNYDENEDYKLKSENDDMYVYIISGNGQGGSYFILKDQKLLGVNEKTFIGKASDNINKTIQVFVTIQDKLAQTNWTGVQVIVFEGDKTFVYPYANELPADKDIAAYKIEINIKKKP